MQTPNPRGLSILALIVAVVAVALSTLSLRRAPDSAGRGELQLSLLNTLDRDGVIRAGYGLFPPFTEEAPDGKLSGVSVDIVEEIARQVGARVEWRRFNWNTMGASLKRGEFDVIADPIFLTPQRGRDLSFTQPYSFFAIGIGVVRLDETRFKTFDDINNKEVSVAVGQGTGEESFVRARAPKATILSIPIGQDSATAINSVLTGRADIAITNIEDARRFVTAHEKNLRILWDDKPPAYVPAAFVVRPDDVRGLAFLNVSLQNFRSTGILTSIGQRHGAAINMSEPASR